MKGVTCLTDVIGDLTDIESKNAPEKLYYHGNLNLLSEGRKVSVVGSRKVSKEGFKRTEIITKALVEHGICVVSGLAEGVDTVAHRTAINQRGKTITVLGTPIDTAYPKSNYQLLELIKKDHLAISQFPENYPFQKKNFPMRNRTMALISDATIIVEASENSGTRHQGWEALRLGRMVFIMQNVIESNSITWTSEMINYGAQVLRRDNMDLVLEDIPYLTARRDFAF